MYPQRGGVCSAESLTGPRRSARAKHRLEHHRSACRRQPRLSFVRAPKTTMDTAIASLSASERRQAALLGLLGLAVFLFGGSVLDGLVLPVR